MKNLSTCALPLALFVANTASAQILLCTDEPPPTEENYHFDTGTGVSVGPLFFGLESISLAADDVNQLLYIGQQSEIYVWPYNDPNPPSFLVVPTEPASGNVIRSEAMAFANGELYAVEEFGGVGIEGIYRIDVVTGDATPAYLFPDDSIDIGGLSFNPTTGTFFGTNDSSTYTDPGGVVQGRGLVEFDILGMVQTETFIAAYPAGVSDVDGCAADPAGKIYLIQDEQSFLDNYDLGSATWDLNPPLSPVTQADTFSGGAWSDVFDPNGGPGVGTQYCTTNPNSTGASGVMSASGSAGVVANDLTLRGSDLPPNSFGFFLVSDTQGFVANPGGSEGNLCLSGAVGRYVGAGQIQNSGTAGEISLLIDNQMIPSPTGFSAVMAGDILNFQAWHRDTNMGTPVSNFTNGLEVTFN